MCSVHLEENVFHQFRGGISVYFSICWCFLFFSFSCSNKLFSKSVVSIYEILLLSRPNCAQMLPNLNPLKKYKTLLANIYRPLQEVRNN